MRWCSVIRIDLIGHFMGHIVNGRRTVHFLIPGLMTRVLSGISWPVVLVSRICWRACQLRNLSLFFVHHDGLVLGPIVL